MIPAKEPGPWAVEDCSVAAQNLMLAVHMPLMLGTRWIGFAKPWLCTPEGKTAPKLGLECTVVAPIIVGHPKTAAASVPRKEPDVQWVG